MKKLLYLIEDYTICFLLHYIKEGTTTETKMIKRLIKIRYNK